MTTLHDIYAPTRKPVGIGTRMRHGSREYLVVQTTAGHVALILLSEGNRQTDPIKVGNIRRLTKAEVGQIIGPSSQFDKWEVVHG